MERRYRIVQAGLGPVGQAIARLALHRENLQLVAAVDPDPAKAGKLGHVRLEASCRLVAAGLGWQVEDYAETIEPVIAGSAISSQFMTVKPGQVAGQHQIATLMSGVKPVIVMDLAMALGADNPRDQIEMDSDPPVNIIVQGGYQGDKSTAAVVVNSVPMVIEAQPGLLTVADFSIPHAPGAT